MLPGGEKKARNRQRQTQKKEGLPFTFVSHGRNQTGNLR